ncbi:MAG: polysaccharide biosynthesis tyrosine autokinase [Planctomycetota bacterium]
MVNSNDPLTAEPAPPAEPLPAEGRALHGAFAWKAPLLDYGQVIRARLNVFLAVFVGIVGVVALYTLLKTPIYRASCRLQIEPLTVRVTRLTGVYDPAEAARDFQARRDFLQTQMENIRDVKLLTDVFERFEFAQTPEFRDRTEPIKAFRELVGVRPVRNTFLMDISFDWKDPRRAAEAANYLTQRYMVTYRERQLKISSEGIQMLRNQLPGIERARMDALTALLNFKKEHHVINLDDAHKLLASRMSGLMEALISARVEEAAARAAVDSIAAWKSRGGDPGQTPEVLGNSSITAFKLEYLRAQAEMLALLNNYGKTHPTVQTQEKVVNTMAEAVKGEIANSVESAKVLYERSRLRSELLRRALAELESEAFKLDELGGTYRILEDTYNATEEKYRLVINRVNEIEITEKAGDVEAGGNVSIIHEAEIPQRHAYPRRGLYLLLASLTGALLGAGLCLLMDHLDPSVKSKEEAETVLGVPVLGFVPRLEGEALATRAIHDPHCNLAEAFRTIRTSLGLSFAGRKKRAFLVTSANPGEGKTMVAFNLAIAFARDGKRVLLMECDMRRPRFREILGPVAADEEEAGLSKVLVEAAELSEIIRVHPDLTSLHFAPCGSVPPNPAELLGSRRFREVLKEAIESYDMVVLDSPPVLNVADSSILAGTAIPAVLVLRIFSTDRRHAMLAAEQIRTVQGNIVGAVINNVDAPSNGYYGLYHGGRRYYYRATT